jgi:hypothetical protein
MEKMRETVLENLRTKTEMGQAALEYKGVIDKMLMSPRNIFEETIEELKRYQNEYSVKADESTDLESLDSRFNECEDYFDDQVFKILSEAYAVTAFGQTDTNTCNWIAFMVGVYMIPKLNKKFETVKASFWNLKETVKNR